MKSGLFGVFILGVALCALSTISGIIVFLVEASLFSTQQIERLAAVGMAFCSGVLTCVFSAFAFAALEYADKAGAKQNASRRGRQPDEE